MLHMCCTIVMNKLYNAIQSLPFDVCVRIQSFIKNDNFKWFFWVNSTLCTQYSCSCIDAPQLCRQIKNRFFFCSRKHTRVNTTSLSLFLSISISFFLLSFCYVHTVLAPKCHCSDGVTWFFFLSLFLCVFLRARFCVSVNRISFTGRFSIKTYFQLLKHDIVYV